MYTVFVLFLPILLFLDGLYFHQEIMNRMLNIFVILKRLITDA